MPYRDECAVIGLRAIRAKIAPRILAKKTSIPLTSGATTVNVEIVRASGHGAIKSERYWLRCPVAGCGRLCSAIAFAYGAVGCVRCLGVRSRNRPIDSGAKAPHVREVEIPTPTGTRTAGG